MKKNSASPSRTNRRRRYVVDSRMQLSVTMQLVGVLAAVAVLYALAVLVFLSDDAVASLSSGEMRQYLLRANVIYFVLAAAILGVLTIMLTHRVAGPAFVLERAVKGMTEGDYGQRLTLRRRDYLQSLAATLDRFRTHLLEDAHEREEALERLSELLASSDVEEAALLVAELRGRSTAPPAVVDEPSAVASGRAG